LVSRSNHQRPGSHYPIQGNHSGFANQQVLSVLTFETEEEAIEIANSTPFGLSASVWTKDIDRAMKISRSVDAGTIWINTFMNGYAEVPFGGYKESGLGHEMGTAAIDEFTELKTIQIHIGERTGWWAK